MKLIAGLGNPGRLYADSRHNIGFSVVKALAKSCKIPLKRESGISALSAKGRIDSQNIILAMPLTFMNLSGPAVSGLLKKYRIGLDNLLVICDDLDLEFGRMKIRPCGSSGGQRGLQSIIDSLGSQQFCRLRIGIGRPRRGSRAESDYVLSAFNKKEKGEVAGIIERASLCCRSWAAKTVTETMNVFNARSKYDE